jgi:hypothetical protein
MQRGQVQLVNWTCPLNMPFAANKEFEHERRGNGLNDHRGAPATLAALHAHRREDGADLRRADRNPLLGEFRNHVPRPDRATHALCDSADLLGLSRAVRRGRRRRGCFPLDLGGESQGHFYARLTFGALNDFGEQRAKGIAAVVAKPDGWRH